MKKLRKIFYLSAILAASLNAHPALADGIHVQVNQKQVKFPDALPYVNEDGRTMVPLRFISEQLGANVTWDGQKKQVHMKVNRQNVSLPIGEKLIYVDNTPIPFDTMAVIKDNRTMVPLRFISEAFGARVHWNAQTKTAEVYRSKAYAAPPAMSIDTNKQYIATVKTNAGEFKIELFAKDAPLTVNNFVFLAKDHFYDGVPFHRIIKDFMIQTGDPSPSGNGTGGPGYRFADELPSRHSYEAGIVAMANAGPNTNGSQFFICNGEDSENLNQAPHYTIFGKVVAGMETIHNISNTPVINSPQGEPSKPTQDLYIQSISIEVN